MRQRDRVTIVAGSAGIAAAVLVIGGAPRWSLAVIAVPVLVAVGAQLTSRRTFERFPALLAVLGIALGLTALQAIPVPDRVQATLDPVNHELIDEGAPLLGNSPSTIRPLSLDPPATRRAALDLALALALAWVFLRVSSHAQGRYWLLVAVAGACGTAAAVGAVENLFGGTALYGLYTPHHATPVILGPLLNDNSYGSLLVLGAMVSAGLALHTQQATALRVAWMINVGLCLSVAFGTLSRGAALAAGIGSITTAVLYIASRRNRDDAHERGRVHLMRVTVPAVVVVICGLALLVLTSAGGVTQQLEDTSSAELSDPMSKFAAWQSSTELIRETPWIGVGRGGFEAAFTRVHPESAFGTFSHVENEYLQAVIDWGVPGAAAIGVALGWLMIVAGRRRSESALTAGALGGLAAVAAQATVDFGLELPGLLVPAVAVAATLSYEPLREMGGARTQRAMVGRIAMVVGIVGLVVLVVPAWGRTLADDHDLLEAQDPPVLAEAQEAMARHPLDYFAPARAAIALFASGDPSAIKLLNRALELHPTHAGLHRLAGRILSATGHGPQAKFEFQTAMRYTEPTYPTKLVGEILAAFPAANDAAEAIWMDFPRPEILAHSLLEWKRPDVALRYLQRVVTRPGPSQDTIDLLIRIAQAMNDLEAVESASRVRLKVAPGLTSRLALGRALRARQKLAEAETLLKDAPSLPGSPAESIAARMLLCQVQIDRAEWAPAEQCLRGMIGAPNLPIATLREVHERLADVADGQGDKHRAQMERAVAAGVQ